MSRKKNQEIWSWALRGTRQVMQQKDAFEGSYASPAIMAAWHLLELAHRLQGIELNDVRVRLETPGMFIDYTKEWKPRKKKR